MYPSVSINNWICMNPVQLVCLTYVPPSGKESTRAKNHTIVKISRKPLHPGGQQRIEHGLHQLKVIHVEQLHNRQFKARQVSLPPDKQGNSNLACIHVGEGLNKPPMTPVSKLSPYNLSCLSSLGVRALV